MEKRFSLKGINDEESVCSVCGKVELRRVMWLVELDADGGEIGEPFHCGTTCGAKLMGRKIAQVKKVVDNFAATLRNRRNDLFWSRVEELGRERILSQLTGLSFGERKIHPLWAELQRIEDEARTWADAQPITIEL